MKKRTEINKEDAQRLVYTQSNENLIDFTFGDVSTQERKALTNGTQWAVLEEDETYYLDWKNSVDGFGNHYWGHDPIELDIDSAQTQVLVNKLVSEGITETV